MGMKSYIIKNMMGGKWFYWRGGNAYTPRREEARKMELKDLPRYLRNMGLHKIGDNPPLSWRYVNMCGSTAYIEEY
jgi:hypothetical protein